MCGGANSFCVTSPPLSQSFLCSSNCGILIHNSTDDLAPNAFLMFSWWFWKRKKALPEQSGNANYDNEKQRWSWFIRKWRNWKENPVLEFISSWNVIQCQGFRGEISFSSLPRALLPWDSKEKRKIVKKETQERELKLKTLSFFSFPRTFLLTAMPFKSKLFLRRKFLHFFFHFFFRLSAFATSVRLIVISI